MSTGGCMTVHSTGSDSSGGPSFGRPYHRVIPSGMPPRSDRDNRRGPPRGGGYHHDDGSYGPPTVKPRMPRMGPPPNPYHRGGGDNNHRYNTNRDSSQQSVDSRMSRSMEEDEIMEMQRTQQSRGGGALRSPPPPPSQQQQQRPLQTPPRYPSPPPRRSDYDDESVGQETISTSGWRSFYSGDYTTERSVTSRDRYQPPDNNYDQPMPPPPRDTYRPARYGSGGRAPPPSYGGGYHSRAPPRSPPRDYSPPRRRQAPRPSSSHSERPLIEVAPGLMMHLMGTDETIKAIQEGHITVTCCVVCGMDVHCHSASEYVLCPDCRVVSPVHQMDMDDENGAASRMMMTPQQGGLVGLGVKTQMLRTMMGEGDQQQQSRQY